MENKAYSSVIGNQNAPFINNLATTGTTIPNYHSYGATVPINGCSAACYVALVSGSDQGVSDGYSCCISSTTILDQLESAGLTWAAYCEDGCSRGADHFPFLGFATTQNSANVHITNNGFTDFVNEANSPNPPNLLWFTPTDGHNMHDNSVSSGDNYVKSLLVGSGTIANPSPGSLFATNLFKNAATTRTMFYLWWDEYDPSPNVENGPMIKAGYTSQNNTYDEFATLRTMEDNWGLAPLLNAASAPVTSDIFVSLTPPPPTPPPSTPPTETPTLGTLTWLLLTIGIIFLVTIAALLAAVSRRKKEAH